MINPTTTEYVGRDMDCGRLGDGSDGFEVVGWYVGRLGRLGPRVPSTVDQAAMKPSSDTVAPMITLPMTRISSTVCPRVT